MSFDLLSEPIKRYIRDKRWEELRPIQNAAISRILSTSDNYILASRTASGKTEAAFLPILSVVDFNKQGVQVLYISPLIALINDQFYRVEELCKYLDVTVTKWHGEANKSAKDKLINEASGIVLITPESLEAMLVNRPFNVSHLFSNLQFVVIDEIHAFIGSDRGIQLKSILSRIQNPTSKLFRVIGLSATIGDYNEAKKFTGNEAGTKVLLDKTAKDIEAGFRYFESDQKELSLEMLKDIFIETRDNKVLLFPNSRGRAEEVAVKLKKIASKVKGHNNYFSHHSSVDKEVREYVEYFAKNNERQNFCISCTSTLELGIDIGSVDEIIQVDATHSIASLIQRIGRSGRRKDAKSSLILYATNPWSLLQSLACWMLYQEGFIEPPKSIDKAYDIMLHQALSITKGTSGILIRDLINQLQTNAAFSSIPTNEIEEIIDHLIQIDFLEKIQNEVIIGIEGEKIVNSRNFYSVFKTEENFKVVNSGITIGEIPFSPQIKENENILLSAKIWKIKYVDFETKRIEVIKAPDGKSPIFGGEGGSIHPRIREKMLELLYSEGNDEILDHQGKTALSNLRREFSCFSIPNLQFERPLKVTGTILELYTFSGTLINKTIHFLFLLAGIKCQLDDRCSLMHIEISKNDFYNKLASINIIPIDLDESIERLIQQNPNILNFSKWGIHLPFPYKVKLIKEKVFEIDATVLFLKSLKLVENVEL